MDYSQIIGESAKLVSKQKFYVNQGSLPIAKHSSDLGSVHIFSSHLESDYLGVP